MKALDRLKEIEERCEEFCYNPDGDLPSVVRALRVAVEALDHYANRMDDGGTARRAKQEIEKALGE